ncbi:hypothetical protein BLNAU_3167 [Blattamonas nauphoetae]|uniref:Uncharacterized protein n=1 Tax=Blattamonas nauphoetae TaxID=2049346 RepID=A0ABQ9YDG1_9EUKA|nr:hypothetical protein BLNAU_3167 [Blattamonas nauphoetae]
MRPASIVDFQMNRDALIQIHLSVLVFHSVQILLPLFPTVARNLQTYSDPCQFLSERGITYDLAASGLDEWLDSECNEFASVLHPFLAKSEDNLPQWCIGPVLAKIDQILPQLLVFHPFRLQSEVKLPLLSLGLILTKRG